MSCNYYDKPKEDFCLKCGKKFISEGKHLRVCPECKQGSTWKNGSSEKVQTSPKRMGSNPPTDFQLGTRR